MPYIIIARNPSNDKIVAVTDEDSESIAVFDTYDRACDAAQNVTVCQAWPFAVVETP